MDRAAAPAPHVRAGDLGVAAPAPSALSRGPGGGDFGPYRIVFGAGADQALAHVPWGARVEGAVHAPLRFALRRRALPIEPFTDGDVALARGDACGFLALGLSPPGLEVRVLAPPGAGAPVLVRPTLLASTVPAGPALQGAHGAPSGDVLAADLLVERGSQHGQPSALDGDLPAPVGSSASFGVDLLPHRDSVVGLAAEGALAREGAHVKRLRRAVFAFACPGHVRAELANAVAREFEEAVLGVVLAQPLAHGDHLVLEPELARVDDELLGRPVGVFRVDLVEVVLEGFGVAGFSFEPAPVVASDPFVLLGDAVLESGGLAYDGVETDVLSFVVHLDGCPQGTTDPVRSIAFVL